MSTTSAGAIPGPRCCCGSSDCAFLAHNGRLLDGLERDVSKAAQLGQALLVRHEAYVADSERERRQMLANIERLENEKLELEAKNAQTIKQNRDLLDQLEQLNESVCGSDAQIQALQDTLRSTEEELQRLASLSARTQLLEAQLFDLEREQSRLQHNLDTKTVDERTAIQRWQKAERTLGDLQDQIDRIEREAREERERHVEVVARMERRMAVESELNTAAARLKAKAGQEKDGSAVVSHFVKDILLDNANLQHGILELREMLVNSNEEVERLRDQLRVHQPVSTSPIQESSGTTLDQEIDLETEVVEPIGGQELHIHHHYHGSKPAKSLPKVQAQRRHSKKKRFSLTSGHFDPAPSLNRTSTATILSQTAVTVPNSHRWSQATTLGPGSLPSSPVSDSYRGSMYDRVFSDAAYDSSRPTSPPDSIDMHSPMFGPTKSNDYPFDSDSSRHHRRSRSRSLKPPVMLSAARSASTPIVMTTKSAALAVISAVSSPAGSYTDNAFAHSPTPIIPETQAAIPEETEEASNSGSEDALFFSPDEVERDNDIISTITPARPALRRHASHESLISISGMDIHTLQSRPAQLLMSTHSRFSTPKGAGSVDPELTPWTATAHGSLSQRRTDNSDTRSFLYSTIANQKRGPRKSEGPPSGKSSGGWFFGKWGATPTSFSTSPAASPTLRPTSSESRQTQSSQDTAKATTPEPTGAKKKATAKPTPAKAKLRPSGVNQNGPIWGFFDSIPETPTKVVVIDYDAEALGEALNDRSPPRIIGDV
ncbi:uncharacterized protein EKO05_0003818 [Ascochyta rabiei]|uniref:Uncharacterized protein n=1 Tax=Didymella rabiei TaxID=5454 RepID=A0A163C1G6_DIDRA|nr:uncharacterized protein EKO05_0003818 [Ascochyta rabiei]KZM22151.1 hypothetical protein ST47_g6742 [Ascochyta rabiei]UPX13302.1 hypothetical protein EKO05_0003818 [Ascochyta rabiei]